MRRFLCCLAFIFFVPFVFPLYVHAETLPTKQQFVDYMKTVFDNKNFSNADYFYNYWIQHPNNHVVTRSSNPSSVIELFCGPTVHIGSSYIILGNDCMYYNFSFSSGNSNNPEGLIRTGEFAKVGYNKTIDNIYLMAPQIDFDNIYYSPNIPLPNMDVYYILSSNSGGSKIAMWNAEMSIEDNSDFYIQYGYKITVPGLVGIGLDSSTGNYDYSYESYSEGTYIDYVSLEDMQTCVNISFGSNDMNSAWQSAYDNMYDILPEFYAKIPFWVQNPTAAKYVEAQAYYKDYMMTQLPMFGNRLELFVRFFTINEDNHVIVGDWLHWSSRTGSRTQEKPSNYIDNVELPGYVNSSNNVNLESENNTYQQSGESVGASTIINNNYAPNYPDYPTIASYNKDNLLLDTMGYMSNMNNFLSGPNGFGHFLTEVFTFIPAYVWGMVAMGFGVAIIVMFIKML